MGAVNGHSLISGSAAGTPEGPNPKRVSNSVSYLLPKLGGVYGQVTHSFGEQADNSSLSSNTGLRLGYAAGALNLAGAYGLVRGGTAAAGLDYKTFNLGASYKLGAFTPMVLVASDRGNGKAARKLGSSLSPTPNVGKKLTGYEIGLHHNFQALEGRRDAAHTPLAGLDWKASKPLQAGPAHAGLFHGASQKSVAPGARPNDESWSSRSPCKPSAIFRAGAGPETARVAVLRLRCLRAPYAPPVPRRAALHRARTRR